jgi:Ca2+-binding RTX toxin-like protein
MAVIYYETRPTPSSGNAVLDAAVAAHDSALAALANAGGPGAGVSGVIQFLFQYVGPGGVAYETFQHLNAQHNTNGTYTTIFDGVVYNLAIDTPSTLLVERMLAAAWAAGPSAAGVTLAAIGRATVLGAAASVVYSVFKDDIHLLFDTIFGWQDTYVELLSGKNGNLKGGALYPDNIPGTPIDAAADLISNLSAVARSGHVIRVEETGFLGSTIKEYQLLAGSLVSKLTSVYGEFTPDLLGSAFKNQGAVGTWNWAVDVNGTTTTNDAIIVERSGLTIFENGTNLALRVYDGEIGDWKNISIDVGDIAIDAGNAGNGGLSVNGEQVIIGSSANDGYLSASGTGKSYILAGAGIDNVQGSSGSDHILLEATYASGTNTGDSPNSANGYGGNDFIVGGGSVDTILGGSGDDRIRGGNSSDILNGEDGDDIIFGDSEVENPNNQEVANDSIVGGKGIDKLYGGEGDDILVGGILPLANGATIESITANLQDDLVTDTLVGGQGFDQYFTSSYGYGFGDISDIATKGYGIGWLISQVEVIDHVSDSDGSGIVNPFPGVDRTVEWTTYNHGSVDTWYDVAGNLYQFDWDYMGTTYDNQYPDYFAKTIGEKVLVCSIGRGQGRTYSLSVEYSCDLSVFQNSPTVPQPNFTFDEGSLMSAAAASSDTSGYFLGMRITSAMTQVAGTATDDQLIGTSRNDYAFGIAGVDRIETYDGDDIADGGEGNDEVHGGEGNDILHGGSGDDLLFAEAGDDKIIGDAGNDRLDGGSGKDTLKGRGGDDTYLVDNVEDLIEEFGAGGGVDLVLSSINYVLGNNLENLTLAGTSALSATGNTLANVITGNSAANTLNGLHGNDTLDGGLGDDTLLGGAGNDIYVVDSANDIVTELAGEGTDLVTSSVNFTLSANVENLTLLPNSLPAGLFTYGTGNAMNNTITGNIGDNILDGGAGIDTMSGGAGNDIYLIDTLSDIVIENANSGSDSISSAVNYTLATGSNIENLSINGSGAIVLTGNSGANRLQGNTAANVLNGAGGADTIGGGSGNDTLIGGTGADNLSGSNGSDRFKFAAGDSGQTSTTRDTLTDFAKGAIGTGDVFDFTSVLSRGGSATAATATQAAINQTTGIASFAAGSGTTLADALADITTRFTAATNSAGEFAFFKIAATGNFYFFVSDGTAGVTANDYLAYTNLSTIGTLNLTAGDLTILT